MSRRSDPHPRTRRATAALALSALLALAGCMDAMGPGLLSGGGAPGTIEDSAPGAALPLGQLARACGVRGRALGRQVAHDVVYDCCRAALGGEESFLDALVAEPRIAAVLDREALARLVDPANYLGAAPAMVRGLLARRRG